MSRQERKKMNRRLIKAQNAAGGDKKKGRAAFQEQQRAVSRSERWGFK